MIIKPLKKKIIFSYFFKYLFFSIFFSFVLLFGNITRYSGSFRFGLLNEISNLFGFQNFFQVFLFSFLIISILVVPFIIRKYNQKIKIFLEIKDGVINSSLLIKPISLTSVKSIRKLVYYPFDKLFNTASLIINSEKETYQFSNLNCDDISNLKTFTGWDIKEQRYSLNDWSFKKKFLWMSVTYLLLLFIIFPFFVPSRLDFTSFIRFFGIIYFVIFGGLFFAFFIKKNFKKRY